MLSFKKYPFCLLLCIHAMCQSNDVTACVLRVYFTFDILIGLFEIKVFFKFWLNCHSHLIQTEIILCKRDFAHVFGAFIDLNMANFARILLSHSCELQQKSIRSYVFSFVPYKRIKYEGNRTNNCGKSDEITRINFEFILMSNELITFFSLFSVAHTLTFHLFGVSVAISLFSS